VGFKEVGADIGRTFHLSWGTTRSESRRAWGDKRRKKPQLGVDAIGTVLTETRAVRRRRGCGARSEQNVTPVGECKPAKRRMGSQNGMKETRHDQCMTKIQ